MRTAIFLGCLVIAYAINPTIIPYEYVPLIRTLCIILSVGFLLQDGFSKL